MNEGDLLRVVYGCSRIVSFDCWRDPERRRKGVTCRFEDGTEVRSSVREFQTDEEAAVAFRAAVDTAFEARYGKGVAPLRC